MPLSAGARLGPYEIQSSLGAGGMGEVYRARDTRLDRSVAIKILRAHLSDDPEAKQRFDREARAIASLNHPNICALHDVGHHDGIDYLVMEYLEGETLADRLKKGPLPTGQVLKYGTEICEGLEKAHKSGVIHRDLKPGNIMLTKSGAKLMDFGLAKSNVFAVPASTELDATMSMPPGQPLTRQGTIVGTFQYMSPEQVQGKEADQRSDIFALGAVFYEMATGQRAFGGETSVSVMAAVLERDPAPISSLSPLSPAAFGHLVKTCLAKDPEERFQTVHDLKTQLKWIAESGSQTSVPAAPRSKFSWMVAAALSVVSVILAVFLWRALRPADPILRPLMRLDVDLGPDSSPGYEPGAHAIISPDGDRLVYVSQARLFTRKLDQLKAVEMPGTEGAFAPFFSPDGRWVAFFARAKINKISVEGGEPIFVCDAAANPRGGSWGEDDNIIVALGSNGAGLSRVSAAGGKPAPLTALDSEHGEITQRWPQLLPHGAAVLFTAHTAVNGFNEASIEVVSLADQRRRTLHRGGTYGRYVATSKDHGYLTYVNRGTLFAQAFDLNRLEVSGTPVPVVEQVSYSAAFGSAELDFSRNGTLIYGGGGASGGGLVTVQWLDSTGTTRPFLAKPGDYLYPSLSPDGTRVTLGVGGDIWVFDGQRDAGQRLTSGAGFQYPLWSRDGRYVLFRGLGGMFWARADGASTPLQFTQSTVPQYPWSFTADGKRLAFQEVNPQKGTEYDIWTVPVLSDAAGLRAGKPEMLPKLTFREGHPAISPDGRWVAYYADDSGMPQIYVRAFPDKNSRVPISNGGGLYPAWSRNSHELFFRTEENQIMVATYRVEGDSFLADKPRLWSDKRLANVGQWRNYDLAPDGKHVIALMPLEGREAQLRVTFLLNFFDELQRRLK